MVPLLVILFAVHVAPRHDCVPGPVLANATCTMDIIRECDPTVRCRTHLECWAGLQLDGIRNCMVPTVKLPPDGRMRAAKVLIAEAAEAFEAWKLGVE